jgi:large repetitive protein
VACVLNAWVDWNSNGIFGDSPGEQIATNLSVPSGSPFVLNAAVPAGAVAGTTYARFRCSTATGLGPTGPAPNGEVEDYVVVIGTATPRIGLSKRVAQFTLDSVNAFHAVFAFNVVNVGDVPLTNVQVTDDLAATFAGVASLQVLGVSATGTLIANASFNGVSDRNLLGAGSTLAVGSSAQILLTVAVVANGQRHFDNTATVTANGGTQIVTDVSQDGGNIDPDSDGNPGNNSVPTPIDLPVLQIPIPTLGGGVLIVLAGLLAWLARRQIGRRRAAAVVRID